MNDSEMIRNETTSLVNTGDISDEIAQVNIIRNLLDEIVYLKFV